MSGRVATKVNDARWCLFEQTVNDGLVQSSTRWVDDDDFVCGDIIDCLLAWGEDGGGVFVELSYVLAHFADGVFVDFD